MVPVCLRSRKTWQDKVCQWRTRKLSWILECCCCVTSLERTEHEKTSHQVQQIIPRRGEDIPERSAWLLLELDEVGEGGDPRPALLRGGAKCLEDLWQLVKVGVAGQEGNSEQELCQNAPHRPDVNSNTIALCTKEKFWASVPSGHNHMSHCSIGGSKVLGQPEITEFETTFTVHQQIIGLQIPKKLTSSLVATDCGYLWRIQCWWRYSRPRSVWSV